jgi:hypothetical protein
MQNAEIIIQNTEITKKLIKFESKLESLTNTLVNLEEKIESLTKTLK